MIIDLSFSNLNFKHFLIQYRSDSMRDGVEGWRSGLPRRWEQHCDTHDWRRSSCYFLRFRIIIERKRGLGRKKDERMREVGHDSISLFFLHPFIRLEKWEREREEEDPKERERERTITMMVSRHEIMSLTLRATFALLFLSSFFLLSLSSSLQHRFLYKWANERTRKVERWDEDISETKRWKVEKKSSEKWKKGRRGNQVMKHEMQYFSGGYLLFPPFFFQFLFVSFFPSFSILVISILLQLVSNTTNNNNNNRNTSITSINFTF